MALLVFLALLIVTLVGAPLFTVIGGSAMIGFSPRRLRPLGRRELFRARRVVGARFNPAIHFRRIPSERPGRRRSAS